MSYPFGQIDPEERVDFAADEAAAEPAPRRRGVAATVLAVAVMAVFAGGLWLAYVAGTHHTTRTAVGGGVPTLHPAPGPTKIKPEAPGGMVIPDQNKTIFDEKPGGPSAEELLPRTAPLLPRPAAAPATPAPAPAAAPGAAATAAPGTPTTTASPVTAAAPPVTVPAAKPAVVAEKPPVRPVMAHGRVRIQLGAMRTPEAARREWLRLKRTDPTLLGHLPAVAVRADLGARGVFYRIEAGPVGNAEDATRLCRELRAHKTRCIIAR